MKTLNKHFNLRLKSFSLLQYILILSLSLTLFSSCESDIKDPEPIIPDPVPETPVVVPSKSYYLSKDGDDTYTGTKEKPFRTLEKLNSIDLEPGETVYLEGGTIFLGTIILDSIDSGSKEKPILIASYGSGTATIDGGNKEAAIIQNSYFKFKNINAIGMGRKNGNTTSGIKLIKASYGIIEQVTIEGFRSSGLYMYSCKNIEAIKVVAKHNGFSGIYVTGESSKRDGKLTFPDNDSSCSKNIILRDCVTENNPGNPVELKNLSGNGILIELTKGALIDHCTASNNGWDMPRTGNGPLGIWAHSSDSVIIQYSISYQNKTSMGGNDGGGFGLDGGVTNSIIQYCLSYENEGAGYGLYQWNGAMDWNNNIIRYSISINDAVKGSKSAVKYAGITLWNGPNDSKQYKNAQIYNNIIYNDVSPAVHFINTSNKENFGFYNNVFIGKNNLITGASSNGSKFLGNTYWQVAGSDISFAGHKTLKAWANATGQEAIDESVVGMHIDPLFVGPFTTDITDPYQLKNYMNFQLQATSPLKDKGLDLERLFKIKLPMTDFYGNKSFQGSAPEPGVHELN